MKVPTNVIETFSGVFMDAEHPDPETIKLMDIAHALANTCRYGGHCLRFYSVAEHAVFVSRRLEAMHADPATVVAGLHHDDAEAYLMDVPRPFKPLLGDTYSELTRRVDAAIWESLKLPYQYDADFVKEVDNWALFVEADSLLPSRGKNWSYEFAPDTLRIPTYWQGGLEPRWAEQQYLDRHMELLFRNNGSWS